MYSSAEAVRAPIPSHVPARYAGVAGIGAALPPTAVASNEVARALGVGDGWIERRTGIRSRRRAAAGDRLSDLAAEAASAALADAGVTADAVDLVLVATLSQDELTPNAAPLVAHAIGAHNAGGIDVGAACTGFVSALTLGAGLLESGRAENVLVVGAEMLSRHTDPTDRRTAGLFGDGAGAALLSAGAGGRIRGSVLSSDGSAAAYIRADRVNGMIQMDGQETYRRAIDSLVARTVELLAASDLRTDDVDLFVFHQANGRILTAVGEELGASGRVLDVIADVGNTSAASIPLALAEAVRGGRVWPGARVVLGAVGAGFTSGAVLVEWGA